MGGRQSEHNKCNCDRSSNRCGQLTFNSLAGTPIWLALCMYSITFSDSIISSLFAPCSANISEIFDVSGRFFGTLAYLKNYQKHVKRE